MNADDNGELPEGWSSARIAEITTKVGSGATPRGGSAAYHQSGVPLIRSMNVHFSGFEPEGLVHLNDKQASLLKDVTVQTGDVLLNITGASIGRVCQVPERMAGARVNQHVCIIRLKPEVLGSYLAGYLSSPRVQEMIWSEEYGVTRQALTKGQILDFDIPLPPLAEQRRIVAAVEAVLTKVNAARDRLNRVPGILKRFRQAVLSAACSGRLTADWREENPTAESATALVGRIAELRQNKPSEWRRFANRAAQVGNDDQAAEEPDEVELPESWLRCAVEDIATVCLGGTPSRKAVEYWGGGVLWVSSGEVANCRINDTSEKITEEGLQNSNAKVYPSGTVLIAMIGEGKTRGQTALLDVAASTNQNVAGLVFDAGNMVPEYVWYWALSVYETHRSGGRGGNYPALNGQIIKKFQIPVPPIAEQQEIVRRVGELFALADTIEARLTDARQMADQLTQAVLAKAFRGELVPTEAELARRENRTYEPAADLLARIRAERDQPAHGKPAKSKPPRVTKTTQTNRVLVLAFLADRQPTPGVLNRTRAVKLAAVLQWQFDAVLALAPVRAEFGPYDKAIEDAEADAVKAELVEVYEEPKGGGKIAVRYRTGPKVAAARKKAATLFGYNLPAVSQFIDRMFALSTDEVELFGTVYAAWNDLLLDGRPSDDAAITAEVHAWHPTKPAKFSDAAVRAMIARVREWGYAPDGTPPRTQPAPAT